MVVKLSTYHYGITVKVVQTFGGTSLPNDTLTVWGDNGALCRIYLDGIPDGDTMIFGLNQTDLMGNVIWNSQYPPDLEEPGDYMVSVCGVYALNYDNGMVTGWITAPMEQSMSLGDFGAMVTNCSQGVGVEEEEGQDPFIVRYDDGTPVIELSTAQAGATLCVFDAQGHIIRSIGWQGEPYRIQGLAAGAYLVQVATADRRWSRRVTALE